MLAEATSDPAPEVRRAAVLAIAAFDARQEVPRLAALWDKEPNVHVKLAILDAAARLGGEDAGDLLAKAVGLPKEEPSELSQALASWRGPGMTAAVTLAPQLFDSPSTGSVRGALETLFTPTLPEDIDWLDPIATDPKMRRAFQLAALDAAARSGRLEPAKKILGLFDSESPDVRFAADRALSFSTNLPRGLASVEHDASQARAAAQRWERLLGSNPGAEREAWLVAGFRASGFDIPELHPQYSWELVRATGGDDHISFNAQRVLMTIFRHHPPSLTWPKQDACDHWTRWVTNNRPQRRQPKAPREVVAACFNARG